MVTVFAALVGFFLPWFDVSCGGERAAALSGWQLATGIETLGESQPAHYYLLVIPVLLLSLALLILLYPMRGRNAPAGEATLQLITAFLCFSLPLVEYLRLRNLARDPTQSGLVGVHLRWGFWLTLISGVAMTLLSYLAIRGSDLFKSNKRQS